jgi:hypothetical protein
MHACASNIAGTLSDDTPVALSGLGFRVLGFRFVKHCRHLSDDTPVILVPGRSAYVGTVDEADWGNR